MAPIPGSAVYALDLPLPLPPTGITTGMAHQRAIVPAASAATLASLLSGTVIPLGRTNPPIAVTLEVESASGSNPVFFTCDGLTTASAAGCLQVPIAPQAVRIPFAAGLKTASGGISLYSTAGANVAVFFEWERDSA